MSSIANPLLGTGSTATTANPGTRSSALSGLVAATAAIPGIGPLVNGAVGGGGALGTAVTSTVANGLEATFFSSRVVAIILGLILITGAILLYIGEDLAGAIETGKGGVAKVGAAIAA